MGRLTERGNQGAYRQYMSQMLGAEDDILGKALGDRIYAVGDERFIERTDEEIKAARYSKADTGDIAWPEKQRQPVEEELGPVLAELGISREDLMKHGLAIGEKKMLAIELLCRLSSVTQRSLVQYCGYKREANVGWQRKLFRARIRADASFARRFALLENKLKKIFK